MALNVWLTDGTIGSFTSPLGPLQDASVRAAATSPNASMAQHVGSSRL